MKQVKEKKISFEEAIEDLENIVRDLEKGDLPLDDSLHLYQRGVELTRFCNTKLNEAEKKISILLENANGEMVEEIFSYVEE